MQEVTLTPQRLSSIGFLTAGPLVRIAQDLESNLVSIISVRFSTLDVVVQVADLEENLFSECSEYEEPRTCISMGLSMLIYQISRISEAP
jgi:hypothetical protein